MEEKYMKEMPLEEFEKKMCPTCKGDCNKGITFIYGKENIVKCVDYVKDESKIKKMQKALGVTAKKGKPIMKDLVQEEKNVSKSDRQI